MTIRDWLLLALGVLWAATLWRMQGRVKRTARDDHPSDGVER